MNFSFIFAVLCQEHNDEGEKSKDEVGLLELRAFWNQSELMNKNNPYFFVFVQLYLNIKLAELV